jgi:hypothetical protein
VDPLVALLVGLVGGRTENNAWQGATVADPEGLVIPWCLPKGSMGEN